MLSCVKCSRDHPSEKFKKPRDMQPVCALCWGKPC